MYEPYKKHFPWLIPTFVLVNIGLFVLVMYRNDCPSRSDDCIAGDILGRYAFQSLKVNPLLGPTGETLTAMGALDVHRVVQKHEVWRLLTCMWLHAGVFHVLANMFSLIFVGIRLEQEFGWLKIGVLYIIAGIGGSLLSSLFVHDTISVGASGALFGLLGGMLSELITNWTIYANKCAALMTLLTIIIINLAVGILPHVDNFAHLGGFFSGFLVGFIFLIRPQYAYVKQRHAGYLGETSKPKYKAYQFVLLVISLLLLIAW
ncbi:RHOMBOID-like protein 1 [Impatiens glandulifera]|uniref:RHOMBOID-like protein 1 n=1 Tax=Impatiens glandulifera TaxID=253017 RepID=UPI001FB123FA|nr:RHOMBOID-like protein 1 [Impatiens glandulifera]